VTPGFGEYDRQLGRPRPELATDMVRPAGTHPKEAMEAAWGIRENTWLAFMMRLYHKGHVQAPVLWNGPVRKEGGMVGFGISSFLVKSDVAFLQP
jgi:hypothetical protein